MKHERCFKCTIAKQMLTRNLNSLRVGKKKESSWCFKYFGSIRILTPSIDIEECVGEFSG